MSSTSYNSVNETRNDLGLGELRWCESCMRRPVQGWVQEGDARFFVCVACAEDRRLETME